MEIRRIIPTIALLLLILISACTGPEPDEPLNYFSITNKSNHLVLFELHYDYYGNKKDSIFIPKDSAYNVSVQSAFTPFPGIDSIIIFFDNKYSVTYKPREQKARNPLFTDSYKEKSTPNYSYGFYYSITEDDYLAAKGNE